MDPFKIADTVLLLGIFLRMGAFRIALDGLVDRVKKLERNLGYEF